MSKVQKSQEPKQGLAKLFALELRTKVIAAAVATIVAGILAVLAGILPDYGDLEVAGRKDRVIIFGDPVKIDPMIEPRWWPLHRARFIVEGFGNILRPHGGMDTEFPLPIVKERSFLSKLREPLAFDAMEQGKSNLKLRLLTSGGRMLSESVIALEIVRHAEYAGTWAIVMGSQRGSVILHTKPGDDDAVYGLIMLDSNPPGLVSGHFTGTEFVGSAIFGDSTARARIVAATRREKGALIASGTSELFAVTDGDWQAIQGTSQSFTMSRTVVQQ